MRKVMWLILFSGSLLGLVDWGRCQDITLDGDIRDFAVGNMSLYVLTDEHLYKVSHHLAQITDKISQRGRLGKDGKFERSSDSSSVGESTYKVNLLVPFIRNNTLITCGSIECGYCEVLDMNDFSKSVHYEQIDVSPNGSAIAFVVDIQTTRNTLETYIFAASMLSTRNKCPAEDSVVTLRNTNDRQTGEIFSDKDQDRLPAKLTTKNMSFNFVDGFQNDKYIYLFRNHRNGSASVQLIWLEVKTDKKKTFASLQGAQLWCCADRERPQLLSSSLMSGGPPVLWAGVFSSNDTRDPLNTALAIYDVSPGTGPDPVFCSNHVCKPKSENKPQPLKLVPVSVVFHYQSMTSVLAITQGSWVVFFIGTGDGQLIKLAVDKNYNSSCSRVIFRSDSDVQVFPKMHLDPVDPRHIYMVLGNQMKRVPVATCSLSITPKDCWISQDPFCGWCESKSSCTFKMDCSNSTWISIPDDSKQQQISHLLQRNSNGQITLTIQVHLSVVGPIPVFTCNLMPGNVLCPPSFPTCTCSNTTLSPGMFVRVRLGKPQLVKELKLVDCSTITGPPTFDLCSQCVSAGCSWRNQSCSWTQHPANTHLTQDAVCQMDQPGRYSKPEIFSILPAEVSFHGRNHALLTGSNLSHVTRVRIQGRFDCSPKESPVWSNTGSELRFHIPAGDKGLVTVCLILPDGSCHGTGRVTYISAPSCSELTPSTTWASGGRRIRARGTHLELVEGIIHGNAPQVIATKHSAGDLFFYTPPMDHSEVPVNVNMKVANHSVFCHPLTFQQDPRFISFTYTATGNNLRVTIQKEADKLNISKSDLTVLAMEDDKEYECVLDIIETSNGTDSIDCDILNKPNAKIDFLRIKFGDFAGFELRSEQQSAARMALLILPVFLVILVIVLGVVCIYRNKQRKLTAEMNERLELLECDIRQEIRQGFVDLQTDHSDLIENMGAIPFLDYKHFASRIFFPEGGPIATTIVKDIGQDVVKVRLEQSCQALSTLIQDQLFLTSMIHALEEQKTFTIKDKCKVASLLSVALHGDLPYLTSVMEGLLRALMDQPSNNQPKLLLRRTESIVEKLLTNWMSICLYGFLRESAGQHLFLLVSALTQQISKGPVDSVTEKALYTLNEDWLLYQAPDFTPLKLKALFAVGTDGEVSDPLEVAALSCDTVEQVKEKILLAHKNKFGFPYSSPLRDIHIECEQDGRFAALQEVDSSSQVLGDVTMLNTLRHYQVSDGMTLKVVSRRTQPPLSPQGSLKDDLNFSAKYFHLIDPEVIQDQRKNPERKKLKLKEVHLTKLLSTKVAVHSYVEKLFRTIWGTTNGNAPCVVKYFFDFLDAQADSKRISDPDVTHIWKTNSLPLRFWVNILKNPQFVFDMEKSPHLDSCLSVIAQAFMDSFSLSEIQLGKHAATNKLLYAKDIPLYKQEVKAYYKQIKDQPKMTSSEFKDFLLEESKKHENEFNESEALRELYKCMQRYFDAIKLKLEQNGASVELQQQLQNVKVLFDDLKSSSWD